MCPRTSSRCSAVTFPRSIPLSRLLRIRAIPRSSSSVVTSYIRVCNPAAAQTCAIPWPMVPAPSTATVWSGDTGVEAGSAMGGFMPRPVPYGTPLEASAGRRGGILWARASGPRSAEGAVNAAESNRSRRPNGGAARAERFHIPLLLCCAEDNEVGLVKVVDALHREGMAPEVVPGVELDPAVLGEAVDRTDGPALFVLCQTDELEKAAIRRLTGLFSARRGPGQQLVTVSLNAAHPLAVLPTIR